MTTETGIAKFYGVDLANLIAQKILLVDKNFPAKKYIAAIDKKCGAMNYSKRIELHADKLARFLPQNYLTALKILLATIGPENKEQTGMFKNFYWLIPYGKFVEKYGLDNFNESFAAIAEITKRSTGEYAVRAFIRKYPKQSLKLLQKWSKSKNFHLRRLASEGLRPKLPWATKLEEFVANPQPVFSILENMIADEIKFVQKSVANNIADYIKVNKKAADDFILKHKNLRITTRNGF